ncbi:hypothetical protein E1B28_009083 [Marasmius oreades]|uniref:Transmembrane protein n=1 Tax=Marasmius oreades TaxID=181124 RepID=A0A9P7S1B5_9AGAR|nr:uncharacterized protein E1B28_009083 [Marasmius oreades]KAG7092758.1 hypothetical protein E1B28_009083 [Marasmius oreades]
MVRPRAASLPVRSSSSLSSLSTDTQNTTKPPSHIFSEKEECFSPVNSFDLENHALPSSQPTTGRRVWILALAPLFLHFTFVLAITVIVMFYIDRHDFNSQVRRPRIVVSNETSLDQRAPFGPTQSDVNTFLSSALVILRIVTGMWCGALVWRCVFILLEKEGITLHQIKRMISLGLPPVSLSSPKHPSNPNSRGSKRATPTILVAIILILAIPYQFSSPILTGSIVWAPSSIYVASDVLVSGIGTPGDGRSWRNYCMWIEAFTSQVTSAAGIASKLWGATADTSAAKRYVSATQELPVNSTLNNVTLPYFNIKSMEWVRDPIANGSDKQLLATERLDFNPFVNVTTTTVGILQDAWELPEDRPFPEPVEIREETKLMVFVYYHTQGKETECYSPTFGPLPEHIGVFKRLITTDNTCYLFAWVTYEAGAATCRDCRVSSPGIVESQRDSPSMEIKKDPMTLDALLLLPQVSTSMALMNVSLPQPFGNIEAYAKALLVRSYEAGWNALTTGLRANEPEFLTTGVKVSIPMSKGIVKSWRVAVWVVLNFLLTISGLLFVFVQTGCKKDMVADTTMAALLLDMTDVVKKGPPRMGETTKVGRKDSDLVGKVKLCERKGSYSVKVVDETRMYDTLER